MTFLIRMGFWFSLVLLALPFNFGATDADAPSVGPIQTFFAAKEAVSDVAGICERKPDVCETGKAAFDTISVRARESARMAMEMIEADPASPAAPHKTPALPVSATTAAVEDTLHDAFAVPVPSARPADAPRS
jgi:hypothetical protein